MVPSTMEIIKNCYKLTGLAKLNGICEYLDDILGKQLIKYL